MHGRLKVKTTAEQEESRRVERKKKLKAYQYVSSQIFAKRDQVEYDDEVMVLTEKVLTKNPDEYTLWNIRCDVFLRKKQHLSSEELTPIWNSELELVKTCLVANPKSYGSWQHRCFILSEMANPNWGKELQLCNLFLQYDERNFHCWDYRRIVVNKSCVSPGDELDFTTEKISNNFSNYSSWHYRSKLLPLIHPDASTSTKVKQDAVDQEFELVQNAVFTDPNDQSAWFYHRWLLGKDKRSLHISDIDYSKSSLTLTFTQSVQIKSVVLAGTDKNINWRCPLNENFSHIWRIEGIFQDITITLIHGLSVLKITLTNGGSELHINLDEVKQQLGSEQTEVLSKELDSCLQLAELEPDNKWVLLTVVLLMRSSDHIKYHDDILTRLQQLINVDSSRARYYINMRSKFIWEHYLTSDKFTSTLSEVSLENRMLTSVSHPCYLHHVTCLNLSHNDITSTAGMNVMQRLETLNLSHNLITSVNGLYYLPKLTQCDLSFNKLSSRAQTDALQKNCPKLQQLETDNNPITED